jgi:hypothetical protein
VRDPAAPENFRCNSGKIKFTADSGSLNGVIIFLIQVLITKFRCAINSGIFQRLLLAAGKAPAQYPDPEDE